MNKIKRNRPRASRYGFTINNPFITDEIKVVDINNLTDEQKAIFRENAHDYSVLKEPQNEKFFDFAFVEYDIKENFEIVQKVIAERVFFKDYQSAENYFKTIEFIDYFCFQYEKGLMGNLHLQGFMHFEKPMDFNVVRKVFPTIHLQPCDGTNQDNIDYCCKSNTKLDGYDFVACGVAPAEERSRTDMTEFYNDVAELMPIDELFAKHPHATLIGLNRIETMQQRIIDGKFKNLVRQLHVTYIYGEPDTGKTTYLQRVLGLMPIKYGKITDYKSYNFDEYKNQDIIVFDEYDSQYPLTMFNDILDGQPRELHARYGNRIACYTKAFIISNYAPTELYKKERADGKEKSFQGFMRRINEIIYMPDRDMYIWQKGEPTPEIIATLEKQGARYKIEPQAVTQTQMKGVQ